MLARFHYYYNVLIGEDILKKDHSFRARIDVDPRRIEKFCQEYRIRKLALFGSVLRDDFRPDSDVDVLVEFEPDQSPGFFGIVRMERELSSIFGNRKADLRTARELSRYFRADVLNTAEVLYGAG